jgi:hypothetical protein
MKHARDTERLIGEAMKALVFGFGSEIVNPRIDELKKRYPGERPERFWSRCAITRSRTSRTSAGGWNPRISRRFRRFPGHPSRYRVNLSWTTPHRAGADRRRDTPELQEPSAPSSGPGTAAGRLYRLHQNQSGQPSGRREAICALVLEILSEPGVYQSLKRTLKSGKVDIQGFDPTNLFIPTAQARSPSTSI